MKGKPGIIRPTAWYEGDFSPATIQGEGRKKGKWGSVAIMGAPLAALAEDTTNELLPERVGSPRAPASMAEWGSPSLRSRNQTDHVMSAPTNRLSVRTSAMLQG